MSSYWLNKILYKIKRDYAYRELFRDNFGKAIEGYDLEIKEIEALENYDCSKLFELGAKSMLLLPFAGVKKPGELFTVKSAEEKRKMSPSTT